MMSSNYWGAALDAGIETSVERNRAVGMRMWSAGRLAFMTSASLSSSLTWRYHYLASLGSSRHLT
jgi:hypothetical protein